MDPRVALISQNGGLAWPDNQSLSSDDGHRDTLAVISPSISDTNGILGAIPPAPQSTGHFSPASTGMDMTMDTSAAPTMINSNSSSCADSWSNNGANEQDDNEMDNDNDVDNNAGARWEDGGDDAFTIPKMEPTEEDVNLEGVTSAPLTPMAPPEGPNGNVQVKPKRPRGRPRKHPLTPASSASKITKGRSKTGCITCRKRKKKCDEAKPRCMNCEKNAVVCEGYYEKQIWKSGRERAEEERTKSDCLPSVTMPPIFHGVETAEDRVFWKHYMNHFGNVLTVEGEAKNAFKDIIMQLANQHQGLMHSILAVSSKHIDFDDPYGAALLRENPSTTRESLQERSDYHHDAAMKRLYADMSKTPDQDDPEYETIISARYGQILCLLLQTLAEGNPRGEHRLHLQAYKTLIQDSPPSDPFFYTFVTEFFQYHIFADDLLWHPELNVARLSSDDWESPIPIHPPRLLGVADGLFKYLSQITTIRNTIRTNIEASIEPLVDYTSLYQAAEIDGAIREWAPQWPPGDSRDRVALLYKQVMWVYLFRTIYPPTGLPTPMRRSTLSSYPAQGGPGMPGMPIRRATMGGAGLWSPASPPVHWASAALQDPRVAQSCPGSRNASRTNSMHEMENGSGPTPRQVPQVPGAVRRPTPPSVRRPAQHDRRITLAVEESLNILESFKPSEPGQTLLLIPCLVIGASCFDAAQQDRIRAAVKAVRGYTGLRNADRVSEVLEGVWSLMDQGEWLAAWDWQGVARDMGLDFLCG